MGSDYTSSEDDNDYIENSSDDYNSDDLDVFLNYYFLIKIVRR